MVMRKNFLVGFWEFFFIAQCITNAQYVWAESTSGIYIEIS